MLREANHVYVCTSNAKLPFNLWPQMPEYYTRAGFDPGQIELAGGWKLNCERWHIPALVREQAERNDDPFQVWLDAEYIPRIT